MKGQTPEEIAAECTFQNSLPPRWIVPAIRNQIVQAIRDEREKRKELEAALRSPAWTTAPDDGLLCFCAELPHEELCQRVRGLLNRLGA